MELNHLCANENPMKISLTIIKENANFTFCETSNGKLQEIHWLQTSDIDKNEAQMITNNPNTLKNKGPNNLN